ncbi:class I adenylate-forming enzyme family protein [Rubinisphaera margarita]|uniref:class I adenylate-forming enzyme family protein n=1 Tax=Rubinisphaera margarita TaxID=2909586 RepID=UPI001EE861E7|nr:class I adenylate-forming enzyme family protein [Rubinisphaera margarita]MCG6156500.1 acyl--CoA ligase [Rubinisphaera margarita]
MNLDDLFRQTAAEQPDCPAVLGPKDDQAMTYAQLDAVIDRRAEELRRSGLAPGECIGLHCPSGLDYIVLNYAIWRCRGSVVSIPIELADVEKQRIVREIHLDAVLSQTRSHGFCEAFENGPLHSLKNGATLIPVESPTEEPAGFRTINAAFVRFTSGTTGTSKGVVLSHETIRDRIAAANETLQLAPGDRVVWLLSMSYHFAVSIVSYLTHGATIVLPANLFAGAIFESVQRHQGTFIYGSPLQYAWMVDSRESADLSSIRLAICTTSALKAELGHRFLDRFGIPLTQALGIIEVGLPCINLENARESPAAVGNVLSAYQLQLTDSEFGEGLFEIRLKGPGFLDAYYHPWRTRDQILDDGWFATGDICSVDDQGCLTIHGRSKDVINISGMKFFPQEAEAVLCEHPGIRAARVFSLQDERWGERAQAEVIAATPDEPPEIRELIDWCRSRLAPFKIPSQIQYVASFPRTASGKILHRNET